jgi:hypothetical protein
MPRLLPRLTLRVPLVQLLLTDSLPKIGNPNQRAQTMESIFVMHQLWLVHLENHLGPQVSLRFRRNYPPCHRQSAYRFAPFLPHSFSPIHEKQTWPPRVWEHQPLPLAYHRFSGQIHRQRRSKRIPGDRSFTLVPAEAPLVVYSSSWTPCSSRRHSTLSFRRPSGRRRRPHLRRGTPPICAEGMVPALYSQRI